MSAKWAKRARRAARASRSPLAALFTPGTCAAAIGGEHGRTLFVWGPGLEPGQLLAVAEVDRAPTIDAWEELVSVFVHDGHEWPSARAALAAVERWGGRVLVQVPGVGDVS